MNKQEHLPLFGIGPLYVACIVLPTLAAVLLRNLPAFASGKMAVARLPLAIFGVLLIIFSVYLWIQAVLVSKLDEQIKKNHLLTTGVYVWVRNPVYAAFMILCTGVLLPLGNAWFLILPFWYWGLLTVMMKRTEEKWLLARYGDAYMAYCRKVNRCWPWIPKK